MIKKISIVLIIFSMVGFVNCGGGDKLLPLGIPMKMMGIDTSGDGVKDSFGYFLLSQGNRRIVYQEIDKNGDGSSDEFIWVGSTYRRRTEDMLNDPMKVYEESDGNTNGKIDTIRWYLPNDYISMEIKDTNEDGFFETTLHYSFQKIPVRTEIDSNQDGFADIYIWANRAEIDSDYDKRPDLLVLGNSTLELEDKAVNRRDTQPLNIGSSWFMNPKLIPLDSRSIIGSGTFVD